MRYDKLSVSLHAAIDDALVMSGTERGRELGIEPDLLGITGFTYDEEPPAPRDDDQQLVFDATLGALLNRRSIAAALDLGTTIPTGVGSARVFLRCAEDADLGHLEELGVRVDSLVGTSRPATVPYGALDALTEDDRVEAVLASALTHPRLDLAGADLKLPAYVGRTGRTGAGVIIGVVDTGIDAGHPAFAGRILRVWDQTIEGPGVAEGAYGREEVGSAPAGSVDDDGHGTHVAGIAAGDDASHPGIAPGAQLVIVKTDFDASRVAAGVEYVFRVAAEEGLPAVVNLSLGSHNDAHDGTDPFSTAVAGLVGPGRIVCAAAGNEGDQDIHAVAPVSGADATSLLVSVDQRAPRYVWCNMWHDGTEELELSVTSPGLDSTAWQGTIHYGTGARTHRLADAVVQITTPPPTANGQNALIELRPEAGYSSVAPGAWEIGLRSPNGNGCEVHGWLIDHDPRHVGASAFLSGGTDEMKVGAPAVSDEVIAVGASVTRTTWVDAAGNQQDWGETLGQTASFTSPGPSRDGRPKPDVAAPGAMIISSRSSSLRGHADQVIGPDHLAMAGTSMACPMVTGVVALWLESNPSLTPAQAKRDLIAAARIPGGAPGSWDPRWGHGAVTL